MEVEAPKQKLSYYQRNRDHARAKAKEYYQRITEGKVARRNQHHEPSTEPKRPRGRPRKIPVDNKQQNIYTVDQSSPYTNDAAKSPENTDDIIFEDLI